MSGRWRSGAALALAWLAAGGAEATEAGSGRGIPESRWYVLGALALAGAQALLIAGLLIQSRRRRRVIKALEERERGYVGSGADITEVKLAQQPMEESPTLGELATSLAHEINQPLAAIASNAQAARRLLGPAQAGGEIPAALQDIATDAQRAAQVIRRLRALFKKQHGERHAVDMTAVIKEVVSLLGKDLERRRICLELALPPATPRVLGDVVQLQQVILNVLVNAAEAMTDQAHPRVLRIETNARESGILTITARDSGRGAEASELEHIFERFVTRKVDGLGMGLSISRSIVRAHGGRMWATRNPDHGLTMHIELPSLEREPEHPAR
jgi:signal transduction histidine kinase